MSDETKPSTPSTPSAPKPAPANLGPFGNDEEVKKLMKYGLELHNGRLPKK